MKNVRLQFCTMLLMVIALSACKTQITEQDLEEALKPFIEAENKKLDGGIFGSLVSDEKYVIGDLNGDGVDDGIARYTCVVSAVLEDHGLAVFVVKDGKLELASMDYYDVVPKKIENGIIYCNKIGDEQAEEKYRLVDGKLEALKASEASGKKDKMPETLSAQTKEKVEKWKKGTAASTKRLSINEFSEVDLSYFWTTSYDFGYIGSNYQRMYITFEKVKKISPSEYEIEGFSQVKSNVCQFTGVIKNIEYFQYKGVDENACDDAGVKNPARQGCALADFILKEDPQQKSTGIFMGLLKTQWIIDTYNQIHKGQFGSYDSAYGDQFLGEWISYKGGTKPVAWGVGEIPFARGVLYDGDGDICISPKYYKNGWEDLPVCEDGYIEAQEEAHKRN